MIDPSQNCYYFSDRIIGINSGQNYDSFPHERIRISSHKNCCIIFLEVDGRYLGRQVHIVLILKMLIKNLILRYKLINDMRFSIVYLHMIILSLGIVFHMILLYFIVLPYSWFQFYIIRHGILFRCEWSETK